MAKIDITKTELVWPGKYNEDGTLKEVPRVSLPFQVIETVNESRATREARKTGTQGTLFDVYEGKEGDTFEEGWRNKLIWGDNLLVMASLHAKFAGKVDLIYIDPPFATGSDFSFSVEVGDGDVPLTKEQSLLEEKAYRDTWGQGFDSYLAMLYPRLILMRELLADRGSMLVHVAGAASGLVKVLLDEVFGAQNFRNEIVWWYYNKLQGNVGRFPANHDTIFWFSKSDNFKFTKLLEDREKPERQQKRAWDKESGTLKQARDKEGRLVYYDVTTRIVDDVWRLPYLMPADRTENVGYQTQKPLRLLRRLVMAATTAGDLVADFFCGSGSTLVCAESPLENYLKEQERLNLEGLDVRPRRWIGCDMGRFAIHTARKRLLGLNGCRAFEVLNLGKYERQYWQGVTFRRGDKPLAEQTLYEYLAFILKLYGAQPVAGMVHLHGKKGKAMIHIGAVEAPVTIDEVSQALDECVRLKQSELHVLGWEWEMGLAGPNNDVRRGGPMHEIAKGRSVKLLLLQIPREVMEQQATAKGDVRFFELAYLEAEIKQPKKLTAQVALKDFVIPNTELIPEEVRRKVKKWSDYIDYWAVDWDFRNDTFMQGWVAYRTRKERKLPLVSDPHAYEKPDKYRMLVKVIDIFGNDTSQALDVEVK